ncbi:hypothetical protein C8R42DRAFT_659732 [Lentinula raphanica]|nr:hypothetical protein C8R42DRAFT_659732 [Lentinula raphanica]
MRLFSVGFMTCTHLVLLLGFSFPMVYAAPVDNLATFFNTGALDRNIISRSSLRNSQGVERLDLRALSVHPQTQSEPKVKFDVWFQDWNSDWRTSCRGKLKPMQKPVSQPDAESRPILIEPVIKKRIAHKEQLDVAKIELEFWDFGARGAETTVEDEKDGFGYQEHDSVRYYWVGWSEEQEVEEPASFSCPDRSRLS